MQLAGKELPESGLMLKKTAQNIARKIKTNKYVKEVFYLAPQKVKLHILPSVPKKDKALYQLVPSLSIRSITFISRFVPSQWWPLSKRSAIF